MNERIGREEARAQGRAHYFTGSPCKNGHVANRSVGGGACVVCRHDNYRRWREANRDRRKEHQERWKAKDPVRVRKIFSDASRRWANRNPEKCCALVAKRRAAKAKRTPLWSDLSTIASFYAACPPGHHVDHIVPLRGRNVSGLHVIENLQYLPAEENIKKGNRYV